MQKRHGGPLSQRASQAMNKRCTQRLTREIIFNDDSSKALIGQKKPTGYEEGMHLLSHASADREEAARPAQEGREGRVLVSSRGRCSMTEAWGGRNESTTANVGRSIQEQISTKRR